MLSKGRLVPLSLRERVGARAIKKIFLLPLST